MSVLSKPASRFQAFCSSIIRKRRICPSLCVTASSLPRMHSGRRQLVASTPAMIFRASRSSISVFFHKSDEKTQCNSRSPDLKSASRASLTTAFRSPGSLGFPGDNGSRDATPIGTSFAALSIGGVWAMIYGALQSCRCIPQLFFFRLGRGIVPVQLQTLASSADALVVHPSRSFAQWLLSYWRFFAALSAGSSAGGT